MAKTAANLGGVHTISSLQSTGKRSIPATPKSAFLDLFVLQNQRERLRKEKAILRVRRKQVDKRLVTISKGMNKLLKTALKGGAIESGKSNVVFKKHGKSTVLGY
jgi:hypothetical protein